MSQRNGLAWSQSQVPRRFGDAVSRMLLAPPPELPHAREAAAAEVALTFGLPWLAADLAHRVPARRPGDARAGAVIAGLDARPDSDRSTTPARSKGTPVVTARLTAAFRRAVAPELSQSEARTAIEGLLRNGRARANMSRRHRGERLYPGSRIVVHHRRPDIAIVVRRGQAVGLRLRGRTIALSSASAS